MKGNKNNTNTTTVNKANSTSTNGTNATTAKTNTTTVIPPKVPIPSNSTAGQQLPTTDPSLKATPC